MNTLPLHGMHRCVFIFLLMAWVGSASAYDKPNSITYDPVTRDYFITNLQGKTVTRLDSSFDQKDVITGLTSPKDLLFATFGPYRGLVVLDSNAVKVFNADGYSLIASFPVSGAIDLEDGEPDKNQSSVFYLSDPKAHTIFKVVIGGAPFYIPTFSVLSTAVRNPKALLFDARGRLLVTSDTTNSPIYSMNTSTGTATLLQTTTVDLINSLEEDLQGNFYATSWGDSYIYRFDKDFKNAKGLFAYNKPTGLFFNKDYDVMVVACSNCNKIEFHKLHMVYINDADSAACPGTEFYTNINQQFKGIGTYVAGNVFYAELSDNKGSFKNPLQISSLASTTEPTSMSLKLPLNRRFTAGNYLIRIRSTKPAFYSINEAETYIGYIPVTSLGARDTITFCSPETMTLGSVKDPDSVYVTYVWKLNNTVSKESTPTMTKEYKSRTMVVLSEWPSVGKCPATDSVLLIPSSIITIPFADSLKACEGTFVFPGGDSIPSTRIEWTSRKYSGVRTEFGPSYKLNENDTFTVKVYSLNGLCSSTKTIVARALPRPDYQVSEANILRCVGSDVPLTATHIRGNIQHIKYQWEPSVVLDSVQGNKALFRSWSPGVSHVRFTATDTLAACGDTLTIRIRVIASPGKPLLAKNNTGVVNRNFKPGVTYVWYINGELIPQPGNDSQFVVPAGRSPYGRYRCYAFSNDSLACRDTSLEFEYREPVSTESYRLAGVKMIPNPAREVFVFTGLAGSSDYSICSMQGVVLLSGRVMDGEAVNISSLPPGMYMVNLTFEGRQGRFLLLHP